MKPKVIFKSILVLLIFFIITIFIQKKYTITTQTPILSDSTHLINVANLNKNDLNNVFEDTNNNIYVIKNGGQKQLVFDNKPIRSIELSPDGKQIAFFYEPDNKSRDVLSLMITQLENNMSEEKYHTNFASWDVTSNLHWLDNNYVFFTRHCGTACKGITLLNLVSKETINAVLTYQSFSNQPVETHFKDWFGQEYLLQGIVNKISSETINNKTYLIFDMVDDNSNYTRQNKFLFSDSSLTLLKK